MEKVFNVGVPHLSEEIFENLDTYSLIQCLLVSNTWKSLGMKVLLKRKSVMLEACQTGNVEIVSLILDHLDNPEEINVRNNRGMTPFILSCSLGHTSVVKLLLALSDIDLKGIALNNSDDYGWNGFMYACREGHYDVAKLILDHSATKSIKLNCTRFKHGWTPFTYACKDGHTEVVRLLLEHPQGENIQLTARSKFNWTPFMHACNSGNEEIVDLILKHSETKNLKLNVKNKHGWTAFMYACKNGHTDIVKSLLDLSKIVDVQVPSDVQFSQEIEDLLSKSPNKRQRRD